jgi:hypothetical protein
MQEIKEVQLPQYTSFSYVELTGSKQFKSMRHIFETIVDNSPKYMIFGGAVRDYLSSVKETQNFTKEKETTIPADIDVLLNPYLVKSEEDAKSEMDIFAEFVNREFGAFEVKKQSYTSNFLGRSFAIPTYCGPVFARDISVFTKIDIVYKKEEPFNIDFNVNSLVYSQTGLTTLAGVNKSLKCDGRQLNVLGIVSTDINRAILNIKNKECFGMYKIDVYRLKKMLYKGYTCYTLIKHLIIYKRSMFLKYTPIEKGYCKVETVILEDDRELQAHEIDDYHSLQEAYYRRSIFNPMMIKDIKLIPFNDTEREDVLHADPSVYEHYNEEYYL